MYDMVLNLFMCHLLYYILVRFLIMKYFNIFPDYCIQFVIDLFWSL